MNPDWVSVRIELIPFLLSHRGLYYICFYNIAFVNSERWLAKSRVDITLCQHGKFPATFLLKFFVLYYKRIFFSVNIFSLLIYSYINTHENWKNSKLCENTPRCRRRVSNTISRFSNFHSCWYQPLNCKWTGMITPGGGIWSQLDSVFSAFWVELLNAKGWVVYQIEAIKKLYLVYKFQDFK